MAGSIVLGLWYIGVIGGNVHAVVAGQVYRSAQLTGHNLDEVLASDHIRSVIDLRGGSTADAFYRSELSSCRRFGAVHYDVTLSARRLPPPQKLMALLAVFDRGPYPILFHCKAGADRTGLAATLYLVVERNVSVDRAEHEELTWRYGHFWFGEARPMDDFFDLYRKTSHGQSMRAWISTTYPHLWASMGGDSAR
ncbi:MAG: tyrosine-protein phosphatase [Capsulimonadaceae bacterium]